MTNSLALEAAAKANRSKVAIGLDASIPSAERMVNSVVFATRESFIEPLIVTNSRDFLKMHVMEHSEDIPILITEEPEAALVEILKDGVVDAAVRGNLSSRKVVSSLKEAFSCKNLCRVSILEIDGRLVLLAPVGIDEGDELQDLVTLTINCMKLADSLGIKFSPAVISGGRFEDAGRSRKVDLLLHESGTLLNALKAVEIEAKGYGIEIERALDEGATMLLMPDGIYGNLAFRCMALVGSIESYGACATAIPKLFVDTSRAKSSYLLPLILASAMGKK
uniref:Methyltransferase n=1 Tax=Candidatus Methanomethylicus mesodigestus TaxID=1867258 RepID=A0A7C3F2F7_9CREN